MSKWGLCQYYKHLFQDLKDKYNNCKDKQWYPTYVWIFFYRHIKLLLELCNWPHSVWEL